MPARSIEQIRNLCKRRGFIFPGSAAYGGLGSFWDYGPLGVEMLHHIKRAWWRNVVYERDDMEGLDGAIITSRKVWQHSGHEATFSDPLVDCRDCRSRFRADQLLTWEEIRDSMLASRDACKAILEHASADTRAAGFEVVADVSEELRTRVREEIRGKDGWRDDRGILPSWRLATSSADWLERFGGTAAEARGISMIARFAIDHTSRWLLRHWRQVG